MRKDMTKAEFDAACKRRNFTPGGFMGYYHLPLDRGSVMVSILNAGPTRREQLAYLIDAQRRRNERDAKPATV